MADRWDNTTGGESFRFFTAEQVDQILRDGARQGRAGSHAAIERILKHEHGVERADLWRRIRRLKHPAPQSRFRHAAWNPEDDQILRSGYEAGWTGRRQAIRELLKRHPDWRPHIVWRRAAKLGLTRSSPKRKRERAGCTWSEDDDRILLNLAGYKHAKVIAKILHRSVSAVRYRLAVLGKSSRFHKDGYARRALAMALAPNAGKDGAERLHASRKHARTMRKCRCGRTIRGNAFFRHSSMCQQANSR
ncbi:MAG: hypothetical protein L0Z53_08570 [Acidobacteriales bacterium]|nr:hypothetical protein [Terriglobales bacterium]